MANDAAVWAANSSSSVVVTPGYTPWMTFWEMIASLTNYIEWDMSV